jgi:signal peptidase I
MFGFLMTENVNDARTNIFISLAAVFFLVIVSIYVLFDAYRVTKPLARNDAQLIAAAGYRKPWLAVFLSAIIPGIGQLYNKQLLKGLALIATLIVLSGFEEQFPPLLIAGLLVYLFGIKDAFDAAEARNGSNQRFFQQDKAIVRFICDAHCRRCVPAHHRKISSRHSDTIRAMIPTLQIGDHVLTRKFRTISTAREGILSYTPIRKTQRRTSSSASSGWVEHGRIINGELYINDQLMPRGSWGSKVEGHFRRPFSVRRRYTRSRSAEQRTASVPRDGRRSTAGRGRCRRIRCSSGDNRDNSMDSRT